MEMSQLLLGILIVLAVWLAFTEWRLSRILRGKNACSLEDIIVRLGEGIDSLEKRATLHDHRLVSHDARIKTAIRGVATVRFNPFAHVGSNQSFATAFLNEDGKGVIVSSLFSRDRVSVFAKPIAGHTSEYELTPEEKQALAHARLSDVQAKP